MKCFFTKILFIAFINSLYILPLYSQQSNTISLEKEYDQASLNDFIVDLESKYDYSFFYEDGWLKDVNVSGVFVDKSIQQVLEKVLQPSDLEFIIRGNNIILLKSKQNASTRLVYDSDNINDKTIIIGADNNQSSLTKISLSGYVLDGANGEKLYGVTIVDSETNTGVTSNKYGYYSIDLVPGIYNLTYKYIGFEPLQQQVLLKGTGILNMEMFENTLQLKEVIVSEDNPDKNISSTDIGTTKLDIESIENIPAFLGEVDIVRSLLLLPGVTTVGEGASGFNVRGGSTDQNLVLFDDATIYNPAHLFGFFSNFNADIVKNVALYKGGIPAKYGGRTASVLDITSRNANMDKFNFKGGVGLVSSRLTLEIPVIKDKSSLLIGGRASYSDWMLNKVNDIAIRNSSAQFYDLNAKWSTTIGSKDRISVSGYMSNDEFKFAADTAYNWRTQNGVLKWNHLFNKKISTELLASTANYNYTIDGLQDPYKFEILSGISKNMVQFDVSYSPNLNHQLNIGGEFGSYTFNQGERTVDEGKSSILPKYLDKEHAYESAIFIQENFKVNNNLSILGGLRYSIYNNLGPGYVLNYEKYIPKSNSTIIDSTFYSGNSKIETYHGLEPRLSLKYSLDAKSSVKLSYNRLNQYIHIISNTTAVTPIDIWKSSDTHIAPQRSDQLTAGYFRNFDDNAIETSVEIYYKWLDNVIDYKNGAELLLKENIEQQVLSGTGHAYGIELFVKKKTGRLNGWVSYTYARSLRRIEGSYDEETINGGKFYPTDYDKPHNLSIVANYKITRRWSVNGNFTYSTGRPITAPETKFTINEIPLAYFSDRNQYRIPDYHRLDFSVTLEGNHKRSKILDGSWTFSIYNVYARKNAYSVFFKDKEGSSPGAYKLSVLGTAFPSLTYNFELN